MKCWIDLNIIYDMSWFCMLMPCPWFLSNIVRSWKKVSTNNGEKINNNKNLYSTKNSSHDSMRWKVVIIRNAWMNLLTDKFVCFISQHHQKSNHMRPLEYTPDWLYTWKKLLFIMRKEEGYLLVKHVVCYVSGWILCSWILGEICSSSSYLLVCCDYFYALLLMVQSNYLYGPVKNACINMHDIMYQVAAVGISIEVI